MLCFCACFPEVMSRQFYAQSRMSVGFGKYLGLNVVMRLGTPTDTDVATLGTGLVQKEGLL